MNIEEAKKLVRGLVFNDDGTMVSYIDFTAADYDTWGGYTLKEYAIAIETLLTAYEKEKEKNKELVEQNEDMKSLFNIQASIAKELDFNTNEKMVKFKDEYYVPDTMAINANIGEPKIIELRYISATKYLTKFDEEE